MNAMVLWLIAKMLNFLENREGCVIISRKANAESVRATLQDSLGFRYELELKCVGRLQSQQKEALL